MNDAAHSRSGISVGTTACASAIAAEKRWDLWAGAAESGVQLGWVGKYVFLTTLMDPHSVCAALCAAVPQNVFMAFSKFVLTVVHNIVLNPTRMVYRKMKTTSKVRKTFDFFSPKKNCLQGDFVTCLPHVAGEIRFTEQVSHVIA